MYRVRIKKPPKKSQDVVDHFKNEMLKRYGKYLITDKGTNRMYYGYPGPDGKLIENNFEVLTGKTGDNSYLAPYTLGEVESKSLADQDKLRITPVGSYPLTYNPDIYGNPGLNIENSLGLAVHATYDPATRNAYYNNQNPKDNYASYGCINCRKPDINAVLKGFGNKDNIQIIDSRKSVEDNLALTQDNKYLYNNPNAARMLFEMPGSHIVRRTWNAQKGVYEGEDSNYDPKADMIMSKKDLAPVTVYGRRNKSKEQPKEQPPEQQNEVRVLIKKAPDPTVTPLQQSLAAEEETPVPKQNVSIVDYLNERGVDSSKANRMKMAQELGIEDYNYRAKDNLELLRLLQEKEEQQKQQEQQEQQKQQEQEQKMMREGGRVPERSFEEEGMQQGLQPVDRDEANIEAERGETITGDFDEDGMEEHMAVRGKRHAQGGTPLQVPPGSFVFSDTKKMKIGGRMLQEFGKSADTKQKYTPAQLAKQYEINKYKAILQNPYADKWEKDTAQLMIENNQRKLAKLGLLQESMKGFPNGIPSIAMPLVQEAMMKQQAAASRQQEAANSQQEAVSSPQEAEGSQQVPMEQMARFGGLVKAARGYYLPVDPYKGDKTNPRKDQQQQKLKRGFNQFDAPWLLDYGYDDTPKGLDAVLKSVGYTGDTNDNKAVQRFLIDQNLKKGNYQLFKDLLTNYRMTNQGVKAGLPSGVDALPADLAAKKDDPQTRAMLEKAFVDGLFGVRSGEMLRSLLPDPKPSTYKVPLVPIGERGKIDAKVVPQTLPVDQKTDDSLNWKKPGQERMPWWTQDKINMAAALGSRYNLQKYMPTYVGTNVVLPNATFFDPTRQLAANQEQAAQQNLMSALYAGPQRLRSVGSNIQGQAATNAANILGQVQNQNVGVANQLEGMRSEILNNQALRNAVARKTYLDEVTTANQQFDNSKKLANENIRANLISGMSNAQRTYWLNKFTPQFNLDPTTGRIAFTEGRKDMFSRLKGSGAGATGGTSTGKTMLANYKELYDEFMKQMNDPTKAHEFAQKMTFGTRSKFDAGSDGDMQVSTSGVGMDPSTMAMMQMFAPQWGGGK